MPSSSADSGAATGGGFIKFVAGGAVLSAGATVLILRSAGYFAKVCFSRSRNLGVVISGSTRGFGYAMANSFLEYGDRVVVSGRKTDDVKRVVAELRSKFASDPPRVFGCSCDVRDPDSVEFLAQESSRHLGHIDVWVNNAGVSQSPKAAIFETPVEDIRSIVETNLLGTFYGSRAAMSVMKTNSKEGKRGMNGHIFNVDGSGSRGNRTPGSAAYGASKAAIPQLTSSLSAEGQKSDVKVGVHVISPGMVTTDLLLGNKFNEKKKKGNKAQDLQALKIFNILAEKPETAADWVVPRMRGVVAASTDKMSSNIILPLLV
eukprot:jgi/Bigna1/69740/fgenesh1_pg.9_\